MGVALEVARLAIASRDVQLPVPLMLLLNGGEETVLTAAHGFMQTSKWADQVTHYPTPCIDDSLITPQGLSRLVHFYPCRVV